MLVDSIKLFGSPKLYGEKFDFTLNFFGGLSR